MTHGGDTNKTMNDHVLINLIEDYAEDIKRLAYTYVKDWSAAEDITQDVFIKCYRKIDSFRGNSSYKTWLIKIAINTCKDYLKSKWYRSIRPTDYIKEMLLSKSLTPEEQVMENYEDLEISKLVLSLPTKYREIIILYYYEGFKIKEIENITGINAETIKTRMRRGKKILQTHLERRTTDGETSRKTERKYE